MSSKNTMTRDAMMFLPAKVVEGLLVIACSSLYTHIFVEGAVTGFNLTNTTVQLVEAAWNLVLFLLLARLQRRGRDRLLPLYLALYAPARFLLEFLRGDAYRGIFLGLSTSQWISLFLFPAALYALLRPRN